MLRTVLIGFLFFLLASCTKQIDIDLPVHDTKPVINSFFSSDSLIMIYLSTSAAIKEKICYKTDVKEVHLYENNNKIETEINIYDSLLVIAYTPKPTNRYIIELLTNSGQKVIASDSLPDKIQVNVLGFKPKIGFDPEGYEFSEMTLEIVDNNMTCDYYELSVVSNNYYLDLVRHYVWSNDVIITNEGDADFYYYNLLFSDKLFNGQKIMLKCYIGYDESDEEIYVCLRSISKNYYKYKKSLMRHFANQEGDIWTGSGNPVEVYSNVEGGYGIFAGYQEDIDTIYISQ